MNDIGDYELLTLPFEKSGVSARGEIEKIGKECDSVLNLVPGNPHNISGILHNGDPRAQEYLYNAGMKVVERLFSLLVLAIVTV